VLKTQVCPNPLITETSLHHEGQDLKIEADHFTFECRPRVKSGQPAALEAIQGTAAGEHCVSPAVREPSRVLSSPSPGCRGPAVTVAGAGLPSSLLRGKGTGGHSGRPCTHASSGGWEGGRPRKPETAPAADAHSPHTIRSRTISSVATNTSSVSPTLCHIVRTGRGSPPGGKQECGECRLQRQAPNNSILTVKQFTRCCSFLNGWFSLDRCMCYSTHWKKPIGSK
jgi:hypothetical protein